MTGPDLKAARQQLGLTMQQLVDLGCGVDTSHVSKWESGRYPVPGPVATLMQVLLAVPAARAYLGLPEKIDTQR